MPTPAQEVFTADGSFTAPPGVTSVDVLIVGGGGGGGGVHSGTSAGGGGGAGEVQWVTGVDPSDGEVNIGAGGAGGDGVVIGQPGGASTFGALTSLGGAGGGNGFTGGGTDPTFASGGGGGAATTGGAGSDAGGAGTVGAGNDGGGGFGTSTSSARAGGGGGGAGADGAVAGSGAGGVGGAGVDQSANVGTSVGASGWFGGGGGGAAQIAHGAGGQGGGGKGEGSTAAAAGTANTGGGGGASYGSAVQNGEPGGSGVVVVVYETIDPPGVPTNLDVIAGTFTADLLWEAPTTGDAPTGYEYRVDAGTPEDLGNVLTHELTGLTPVTLYDEVREIRAYNAGGTSSWVAFDSFTTDDDVPDTAYQADVRIGAHTWTIEHDSEADPMTVEVLAGASFSWTAPDDQGWPPLPWVMPLDTLTLRMFCPSADDVADVAKGDVVRFKFTPEGYTFTEPLVDFAGRVSSDPSLTDRSGGGVFLEVVAVDYRIDLANTTWFGYGIGGYSLIGPTENPYDIAVDELQENIDTALAAEHPEWTAGTFDILTGTGVDATDFPDRGTATTAYSEGQGVTLWETFKSLGIFPWPRYDDAGVLITDGAFRYIDVKFDGSDYETADPIDAAVVPNPSWTWRRDVLPNLVEQTPGLDPRYQGGEDPPARPHVIRKGVGDFYGEGGDFNLYGFANEVPEPSPWALYTFTILGYLAPLAAYRFFTYPHRVRRYITVENMAADKDPTGTGTVSGMLREARLTIAPRGRWYVTAGIRPAHPGPPE